MTTSLQVAFIPGGTAGADERIFPNTETSHVLPYTQPSLSKPSQTLTKGKRTILILDNEHVTDHINRYLTTIENCEVMNVLQADIAHHMITVLKPDLIIMNMNSDLASGVNLVEEMRRKTYTYYVPVIVFTQQKPSPNQEEFILSIGAIDCLNSLIDPSEIRFRIRAAFALSSVLNDFILREEKLQDEKDLMVRNYEQLKGELDDKQRETHTNLELLVYSKQLNESMILKVQDLKPYLNPEGKSKLGFIVKQMKWEITDENQLNVEQKMDQSNFTFHRLLEEKSSSLTKYEKRLCTYFQTNHSSAETARITRRTSNCMNVAFSRIRSKLGVKNNLELQTFLTDLHTSSQGVRLIS